MNTKLVASLAQIIQSLTPEERSLLEQQVKAETPEASAESEKHHFQQTATPEEKAKAFREWVESHRGRNYPPLSDEDISRESIYGERRNHGCRS